MTGSGMRYRREPAERGPEPGRRGGAWVRALSIDMPYGFVAPPGLGPFGRHVFGRFRGERPPRTAVCALWSARERPSTDRRDVRPFFKRVRRASPFVNALSAFAVWRGQRHPFPMPYTCIYPAQARVFAAIALGIYFCSCTACSCAACSCAACSCAACSCAACQDDLPRL
jgi:hypothetical protein